MFRKPRKRIQNSNQFYTQLGADALYTHLEAGVLTDQTVSKWNVFRPAFEFTIQSRKQHQWNLFAQSK